MFGKNKVNVEELLIRQEKLEKFADQVGENGAVFLAGSSDIENSQSQMQKNLKQVVENVQNTAGYALQNVRNQDELVQSMREALVQMEASETEYNDLIQQVFALAESSMSMVEKNKHFTSPSKYISEGVTAIHGYNGEYMNTLESIKESTKQMGVFALNAAIEAGRMGESGAAFVSATEDVRTLALDMDNMITQMQNKVSKADEKVNRLQEEVHRLVGLLKDNNVAMGQLLKQNQSTIRMIEKSSMHSFAEDVSVWKEQIAGMRNTEDEIMKLQERNKMQLEDIVSEMQVQRKAYLELSDELIPMFANAKDHGTKEV